MADIERKWPTIAESMELVRQGILDERHLRVRPSPEERALLRAEAAALRAELEARKAAAAKTAAKKKRPA
ncbi:MAG TPA: hypothetical protein VFE37_01920 [Chloroflexota bacterium]|nr:hypothetical protein [Chloroflexota bacterium]